MAWPVQASVTAKLFDPTEDNNHHKDKIDFCNNISISMNSFLMTLQQLSAASHVKPAVLTNEGTLS